MLAVSIAIMFPILIVIGIAIVLILSLTKTPNKKTCTEKFNCDEEPDIVNRYVNEQQILIDKKKYMTSPEWQIKKDEIKELDGYQCRTCHCTENLEVHHITYENLFNEKDKDLATLCRSCHQEIHDELGYDYKTLFPIKD